MYSDQDILWKFFLSLREKIIIEKNYVTELTVLMNENQFTIKLHHSPEDNEDQYIHILLNETKPVITGNKVCVVFIDEFNFVQVYQNSLLENELLKMLKLYLPLCLNPQISRKEEKAFAVAHFAQSLDGKIATNTGNSRWISGEENLIHAHRMRALCGGILIGMNTLLRDRPALTVRLVEGENPVKIVLGNSSADFSSLDASGDKVVVITNVTLNLPDHIKLIKLSKDKNFLDPHEILKVIYKELKIYTVYVEGGAYTSSYFLMNKSLQQVQMYLSPLVFGSGISNFSFPVINEVQESLHFRAHQFIPMGEGMLFMGVPE